MPATVELYELVPKGLFVVPDACPYCGASFKGKESSLREWEFCDQGNDVYIEDDPDGPCILPLGSSKGGETFGTNAYWCTNCDKELVLEKAPPPTETPK